MDFYKKLYQNTQTPEPGSFSDFLINSLQSEHLGSWIFKQNDKSFIFKIKDFPLMNLSIYDLDNKTSFSFEIDVEIAKDGYKITKQKNFNHESNFGKVKKDVKTLDELKEICFYTLPDIFKDLQVEEKNPFFSKSINVDNICSFYFSFHVEISLKKLFDILSFSYYLKQIKPEIKINYDSFNDLYKSFPFLFENFNFLYSIESKKHNNEYHKFKSLLGVIDTDVDGFLTDESKQIIELNYSY